MKKQEQVLADSAFVDQEFTRETVKKVKKSKGSKGQDIKKVYMLLKILALILTASLLIPQKSVYAQGLGLASAVMASELIVKLVFFTR